MGQYGHVLKEWNKYRHEITPKPINQFNIAADKVGF